MRIGAGLASVLLGLGFGIPGIVGARYLSRTGELWTFLGFPTYGHGPFERLGLPTTVPLMSGFVLVCAAEVVSGILLWTDASYATAVSWALLPAELVFWIGFALPLGPVVGLIRTVLLLLA